MTFEEWWRYWRRKTGRKKAELLWNSATRIATRAERERCIKLVGEWREMLKATNDGSLPPKVFHVLQLVLELLED
jgi:hypothetical protein